MGPSDSTILERLHEMDKEQGITENRVFNLERSSDSLWKSVEEIRRDVGRVKVEVAKVVAIVGIIQVLATGVIVWTLTKGKEEKHAARQVFQTEVRNVVGSPGAPGAWRVD
jgi:myo-inositol-1-phosphate synthase